jgi:hypothetical protein
MMGLYINVAGMAFGLLAEVPGGTNHQSGMPPFLRRRAWLVNSIP